MAAVLRGKLLGRFEISVAGRTANLRKALFFARRALEGDVWGSTSGH